MNGPRTRVSVLIATTVTMLGMLSTPASAGDHFVHQNTVKVSYFGEYGYFQTRNPYVPDLYSQFSLCHLYMDNKLVGQSNYLLTEFGYYKGYGPQRVVGDPRLYGTFQDASGYHEYDTVVSPGSGTPIYQLQNMGYAASTGKYRWQANFNSFGSAFLVFDIAGLNSARVVDGGESTGNAGPEINCRGARNRQLKRSGSFYDWDASLMSSVGDSTYTQVDYALSFRWYGQYTDYETFGYAS